MQELEDKGEDLSRVVGVRKYGKKPFDLDKVLRILVQDKVRYKFIKGAFSNPENNGRCLVGLLMSHYGWDGAKVANKDHIDQYWRKMMNSLGPNNPSYLMSRLTEINDNSKDWEEVEGKIRKYAESKEFFIVYDENYELVLFGTEKYRFRPMLEYRVGAYGVYQTSAIILSPGEIAKARLKNACLFYRNNSQDILPFYGWFLDTDIEGKIEIEKTIKRKAK